MRLVAGSRHVQDLTLSDDSEPDDQPASESTAACGVGASSKGHQESQLGRTWNHRWKRPSDSLQNETCQDERLALILADAHLAKRLQEHDLHSVGNPTSSLQQLCEQTHAAQIAADAELAKRLQEDEANAKAIKDQMLADEALARRLQEMEEVPVAVNPDVSRASSAAEGAETYSQRCKRPRLATLDTVFGGCRCGHLAYKQTLPGPPRLLRCYCRACRRAHGAPWVTLLPLDSAGAELVVKNESDLRQSPPSKCEGLHA